MAPTPDSAGTKSSASNPGKKVAQRAGIPDLSLGAQRNVIKVANLWFDTIQSTESELIRAPPTRRPILLSRVIS
jgi:hypothetical protein